MNPALPACGHEPSDDAEDHGPLKWTGYECGGVVA